MRLTRRDVTAGLAGLTLAGCAPLRPESAKVLVSLATPAPPPPDTAQLALSADVAKRVTAPVFLNGKGPFEFVVDTGANHSVVASELAQTLALASAGRAQVHGIAGVEPANTTVVDRLAVGQVVSRRVKAPLLPFARLGASGLLGVDVLKNRRVRIDFVSNQLEISSSNGGGGLPRVRASQASRLPAVDPTVVTVPARYRFGQLIIIDADVGGQKVTAFLDSGSQNTVGNMALGDLVLADPLLAVRSMVVQLISATGQTASGKLSPLPTLRLGGLRIGGMQAVFADMHIFDIWGLKDEPAILIGIDVMRHFKAIELDFGRKLVSFETPRSAPGP